MQVMEIPGIKPREQSLFLMYSDSGSFVMMALLCRESLLKGKELEEDVWFMAYLILRGAVRKAA